MATLQNEQAEEFFGIDVFKSNLINGGNPENRSSSSNEEEKKSDLNTRWGKVSDGQAFQMLRILLGDDDDCIHEFFAKVRILILFNFSTFSINFINNLKFSHFLNTQKKSSEKLNKN